MMKKYLSFIAILYIAACAPSMENLLNNEFVNRNIYLCGEDYEQQITPGKKHITQIKCHEENRKYCDINLKSNAKTIEITRWYPHTDNYVEELNKNLLQFPYCTLSEYKTYQEHLKQEEEARKQEALIKKEQIKDCTQAVEKAYQRRVKLGYDIISLYTGDIVDLNKNIVRNINNGRVIETTRNGIIISGNDCSLFHNAGDALTHTRIWGGTLAALGYFMKSSCVEEIVHIYTSDTDYATNELFREDRKIYKRTGTYTYNGQEIKAYRQTLRDVGEIEYKTYLKDKNLKCCSDNDKIYLCPK